MPISNALKRMPIAAAANARLKAWLQERDAAAIQRRYAAVTRSSIPAGADLISALRRRIGTRAASLQWPKARGDLHIMLVYSLNNWEAVLPQALAPFGEVSAFEFRAAGFDESAPDWLNRRAAMNEQLLAEFTRVNSRRPVDVVVGYFSGFTVDPEVLTRMAEQGAVITNFCFDDKLHWPGTMLGGRYAITASVAAAVDLNLTSDPDGMAKYHAHHGLCMFHPEAADPHWYRPVDVPFLYDVSFVGACYGWRPRLIEGLRRRGIEVACFGKGWPSGPVPNGGMNELYAHSKINLGCGGIGYSRQLLCLKGRDFEVPMSGAVYLTQNNPELHAVFDVGRELLTYDDIEDCALTIRELLADAPRAARIRLAARARCLRDHTYEARWTHVLQTLGALTMA